MEKKKRGKKRLPNRKQTGIERKSGSRQKRTPNLLERRTAEYFASLSGAALEEEKRLELAVASAMNNVDFDELLNQDE